MKDKKISSDLLFLIATSLWLSTTDFNNITILQLIALIISIIAIVLLIIKFYKKGE